MRVVVRVVAGFARAVVMAFMAVIVAMVRVIVMVVIMALHRQEVGVDLQRGVQVEALEVEHLGQRHVAEIHLLHRRPRIHVADAMAQRLDGGVVHQIDAN